MPGKKKQRQRRPQASGGRWALPGRLRRPPASYRRRIYRHDLAPEGLVASAVKVRQTDLLLFADRDVRREARHLVVELRAQLETYGAVHDGFFDALTPLPNDPLAPSLVKTMLAAGQVAGVGPLAAVAGAMAEAVGRGLLAWGVGEVVVEGGGDVFVARKQPATLAIFAGESVLSGRIGLLLRAEAQPVGVCTSSASVGHSLSFGRADAVTVVAKNTAVADAVATAAGNRVRRPEDVEAVLAWTQQRPGVLGAVVVVGERIGAVGAVELVPLARRDAGPAA